MRAELNVPTKKAIKRNIKKTKQKIKQHGMRNKLKSSRSKTKKSQKESIVLVGYRKKTIARGYVREGNGEIRVNGKSLDVYFPELLLNRIKEPIYIAGEDKISSMSIDINVRGGGLTGQADSVRQIIAKALVERYEDLKDVFIEYDRSLLVPDVRQTEPHKPSRSKQGPRRKKQLSKR